jgi:hypothetical protein
MNNYWIQKTKVKEAAALLETLLNDEFLGELPNVNEWVNLIEDLIDSIYAGDPLIINGLMDYKITYEIDEFGLVYKINLIEK